MITVTTTALNRLELLEKTLESFKRNINDIDFNDCKIIINIDPIPDCNRGKIINFLENNFKEVRVRIPKEANFGKALKWCWDEAEDEFIFHLEDDWILNEKINIYNIIKIMKEKKIDQYHFRAYNPHPYATMSLSPSIIRKKLYKTVCGKLNTNSNPEQQIQCNQAGDMRLFKFSASENIIIKDIGREWLNNKGIVKPKLKKDFVSY